MNIIRIEGLRFHGYHGVYEIERHLGNEFRADIELFTNHIKANTSDNIEDTIDYAVISNLVLEISKEPVHLLEHLASKIGKKIIDYSNLVDALTIKITKLNPPMEISIEGVSVTINLKK